MSAAYVTDTHPLIFHAQGKGRLGKKAAAIFEKAEAQDAIVYVPTVVLWEMSILVRLGRIDLGRSMRDFSEILFSNAAFQSCDLTAQQVCSSHESALPNTDPFDGLISGISRELGVPLITKDSALLALPDLVTIW